MIAMQRQVPADERLRFDADAIPKELRDRDQWVNWTYRRRGDAAEAKVPVDAGGTSIDPTDPSKWGDFQTACAIADGRGYGIGFALSDGDPYVGVDLDSCVSPEGELSAEAAGIITRLGSYTEISPSGTGVKLIARAAKPAAAGCKARTEDAQAVEIYDGRRFFTITGRHVGTAPATVEDAQQPLDELCERLWPARPLLAGLPAAALSSPLSDEQVIQKAMSASNGQLFTRLWNGDTSCHDEDDSSADLALCNLLAFWTRKDGAQMDRLFRQSSLMRTKWDERRGAMTYGDRTIATSIDGTTEVFTGVSTATSGVQTTEPYELGQLDPDTGRLVIDPKRSRPTANAFLRTFHAHPEQTTLVRVAGEFFTWSGGRWTVEAPASLDARLLPWLSDAWMPSYSAQDGWRLKPFPANTKTTSEVRDALAMTTHVPCEQTPPCWLGDADDLPNTADIVACPSALLDLSSGKMMPPTPRWFSQSGVDFDVDPDAPPPARWLGFLDEVFGDDDEAAGLLQEWFGYCLTSDTSLQKMLLIVGPRRSGKGTIARVLRQLVGERRFASPSTSSLAQEFGLQSLIGASVASFSDARFRGRDASVAMERLLCISGEDPVTINRKHKDHITVHLPARIMILSNEVPRFDDASGAMASRFMVIRLVNSFLDREDHALGASLAAELPGILNWSIDGLRRLRDRGRFVQPASAADLVESMEDLGSPVARFVRDRCSTAGGSVPLDELYNAYGDWCIREGEDEPCNRALFGRELRAAVPGVTNRRSTGQKRFYKGITLLPHEAKRA